MLKALLKKQFLELNQFYFQDKKTGKHRSPLGTVLFVGLYALIFIGLAFAIGVLAAAIGAELLPQGLDWLYFAMMGLLAIFLGVFGAVFNTYAALYKAKDNELLLSMPIPSGKILLVRMIGVYAIGLMYEAIVFVPTVVVYWMLANVTALRVVFPILLVFLLGLLVMSLTCALGWVVALVASRIRNKSFVTVLLSLVLFGGYYFCYFRLNSYLQELGTHIDTLSSVLKPFYLFGQAAGGQVLPMLATSAILLGVFGLTYFILSRSFRHIITTNRGEKHAVYREKQIKTASTSKALLRRELKRFTSSPTYMLNCGLGILLMPIVAIAALVKMSAIRAMLVELSVAAPQWVGIIPVALCGALCTMNSMNDMTAPSISLEGKHLWIVRSLPVEPWDVLSAKLRLHRLMTIPPVLLCGIALCFVFRVEFYAAVLVITTSLVYVMLSSAVGLALNLRSPNLTWTNEVVPIKQSFVVLVMILGGMFIGLILIGAYYFLAQRVSAESYLIIILVTMVLVTRLVDRWLRTKGTMIFASL